MRRPELRPLPLAALFIALPLTAATDSAQSPPVPGGAIGALVMWYICPIRKDKEIGGWLLYFYIQLYLGVIVSLIVFAATFSAYEPSTWAKAPDLYPMFLLSAVPGLLLLPAQLVVAEILRRSRDIKWVSILRYVLMADLVMSIVAIAIDTKYFKESVVFDFIGVIWPTIWLPYFYLSKRVRRVFELHDWLTPAVPAAAAS